VYLAGKRWGQGGGRSKKEAEQRAARQAFERLAVAGSLPGGADRDPDPVES
jgi:dsRNA-specific ribonuclease